MIKRLQIALSEEATAMVESLITEANTGFDSGHINYSDAINEMILCSKVDVKTLQDKHTDIKRSLKSFAKQEDPDIDALIKTLTEIKKQKLKVKNKTSEASA
jgi:hypothetical protein